MKKDVGLTYVDKEVIDKIVEDLEEKKKSEEK